MLSDREREEVSVGSNLFVARALIRFAQSTGELESNRQRPGSEEELVPEGEYVATRGCCWCSCEPRSSVPSRTAGYHQARSLEKVRVSCPRERTVVLTPHTVSVMKKKYEKESMENE